MQLGPLDQRITLQSLSVARDGTYRSAQATYVDFATVWANITYRTLSVPEVQVVSQVQSSLRIVIRMRYIAGVTPTMRIKHGDRYYQVLDWNVIGRYAGIHINAIEWNEGRV